MLEGQKSYALLCALKQVLDTLLASLRASCVVQSCAHSQEALSVLSAALPSNLAVCAGVGKQANFKERITLEITARDNLTLKLEQPVEIAWFALPGVSVRCLPALLLALP